MSRDEIERKLRQIFVQVTNTEYPPESLSERGLLEKLHIDSLMALEIIVQIEQEFLVAIDDDDVVFQILDSLDACVDYVLTAERQAAIPD